MQCWGTAFGARKRFGGSPERRRADVEIRQCDGGRAMSVQDDPTANASIPELVSQLSAQTSRLVRDEMRLAQKEFQESARHAGIGAGLISIAWTIRGSRRRPTLVAAAVAALSLVLAVWAAAVIVAAALFLCALVAALISRRQVQQVPTPAAESVDSVKLDIEEIKDASHGHH